MFSVIKRAGLAVGLVVASASVAQAQISPTGQGGGSNDPNWSLIWLLTGSSPAGTTYATPNGNLANANVITTIPTPPWQPNSTFSRWIGVNSTGTQTTSSGTAIGDGVLRFTYEFTTKIGSTSPITGFIGWDNILIGYRTSSTLAAAQAGFGGSVNNSVFGSSPSFNNDGFCRADGEHLPSDYPNCVSAFTLPNTGWAAGDYLTIVLKGDGQTDGLFITTPEPATYLLVAGGLLAMFGASRRRRQSSIA